MEKSTKILLFVLIIITLLLGTIVWCTSNFLNGLITILSGILTGLVSSMIVTIYFERIKHNEKENIKKLKIENFIYSAASLMVEVEYDIKKMHKEINILENYEEIIRFIDNLKEKNKGILVIDLDSNYNSLINTIVYYLSPLLYSYTKIDHSTLLFEEIFNKEEYLFFNNMIRKSFCDEFLSMKQTDRFLEKYNSYNIFHYLRIGLNTVKDATEIFPEIKIMYSKLKSNKFNSINK